MDIDVFPNSIEYWGPNGMVFFRNVQLRWMPIQGDTTLDVRPRAAGRERRPGRLRRPRRARRTSRAASRCPTSPAQYRMGGDWGYVEVAGIVRYIKWDDLHRRPVRPVGRAPSAGASTSARTSSSAKHVLAAAGGLRRGHPELHERRAGRRRHRATTSATRRTPIDGKAAAGARPRRLPRPQLERRSGRARSATRSSTSTTPTARRPTPSRRASTRSPTCSTTPTPGVMLGPEIQWGRRENFRDGFTSDDSAFQFSVKYNFRHTMGGK